MKFELYIAKRYLFSKKSRNVINIITTISVILVAFVSMALFITLSVTNGLNNLVVSMFNTFDPELSIVPTTGKVFHYTDSLEHILNNSSIAHYSKVLEEDVLIKYGDKQLIGKLKGVDDNYTKVCNIDSAIIRKEYKTKQGDVSMAVIGQGIAYQLGIGLEFYTPIQIYAPRRGTKISISPNDAYKKGYCHPAAVFSIQQDIDSKYIISNIEFSRTLLEYTNEVSAIEIKLKAGVNDSDFEEELQQALGSTLNVKNRYEQHEFLYKVMKSEKWIIFMIISLICVIASFSTLGTLTMIVIDKKRDISILKSLGTPLATIKKIFLIEGWLISISGSIIGLAVGLLLSWLQAHYGFIKLHGSGSFVVEAYPVAIEMTDLLLCFGIVVFIGFIASYIPVQKISKSSFK